MRETLQKLTWEPGEKQAPLLPSGTASILLMVAMALHNALSTFHPALYDLLFGAYCITNALFIWYFHFTVAPSPRLKPANIRYFIIVEAISSLLVSAFLPYRVEPYLGSLMVVLGISLAIVSDRRASWGLIGAMACGLFIILHIKYQELNLLLILGGTTLIALVVTEVIHTLKSITRDNINRLEIINDFSHQVNSTLDTEHVFTLLGENLQRALEADTYFIGVLEDGKINLKLFVDEGVHYSDLIFDPSGTLSGWVIENQQELFLPDLRMDLNLTGVRVVVMGKEKTNLAWVGVPLIGQFVRGVMAIASYTANSFNRSDLELMNNMARHAVLALDNAYRHAVVEEQSHLDSLTGVFNHGYFLDLLRAKTSSLQALSLIMLDIDHFKKYNDNYGHIQGDWILKALCTTIRQHIKQTDFIGRWGGEEFAVALPNATGRQAYEVAQRILESLATLKFEGLADSPPSPTASQGIARFPEEAGEMMDLVDLADRRLYMAKGRGRNQIEPSAAYWDQFSQPEPQTDHTP